MVSLLCVFLLPLKLASGLAGSLEGLQSELGNETRYASELVNYTTSHNITMVYDPELVAKIVGLSEFEGMVKEHMDYCKDKPAGPIGGDPFYNYWKSNGDC